MIREKELTEREINTAVGHHDDEAGLQASLGLMERERIDPQNYQYWDITRHIRAIACLREPSWLKFSLEDGSNATRQLRRYKTPTGVNAAVTWFLQGMRFGTDTNEADWQKRRLGEFMVSLARLSSMLARPATVNEVYEVMLKPRPTDLIIKPLKEFIPVKELHSPIKGF